MATLSTMTGGTTANTLSLNGAADLYSIIAGKDTTTTSTNTGGGGTTTSTTGGGVTSTGGSTSSSGSTSSTTNQSSSGTTSQTGTSTGSTLVDQIVSNSGSTNLTSSSGTTTGGTTNSGYTTSTAGSTNVNSGSVNTNSGYTTKGAASVNTGVQTSNSITNTNSNTKIGGRTDVSTTKSVISKEAMDAMLQSMLSKVDGLASVSQGVRAGGGYGGSTNTLLSNDLLTRAAAAVAEATRETVTTNVVGDSYNSTSGSSSTMGTTNSINNIGETSSVVGPSTQTIGGSTTTIGPTSTTVGGSTSSSVSNSSTDGTNIVGASTSSTKGTNTTTGTNTSVGTTSSTGTSGTTGTSSSTGSTSGSTSTAPTTTTSTTNPNPTTTTTNTKVAGAGLDALAGIVGLTTLVPLATDAITSVLGTVTGALSGSKTATGATATNNTPDGSPTPDPVDHSTSDSIYGPGEDSIFTTPEPDFTTNPIVGPDPDQVDVPEFEFADGGRVPGYADGGFIGHGDEMEVDNTAEVAKRASEQKEYTEKHSMSREDFIKQYGETFVSNDKGGNAASEVHGQNVGEYYDKYLGKDAKKTVSMGTPGIDGYSETPIAWGEGNYRDNHPYFDGYDNVKPHPESQRGNGLDEAWKTIGRPIATAVAAYYGVGALAGATGAAGAGAAATTPASGLAGMAGMDAGTAATALNSGALNTAISLVKGKNIGDSLKSGAMAAVMSPLTGGGVSSTESVITKVGDQFTGGAFSSVANIGKLLANPSTSGVANFLIGMNPAGKLINSVAGLTGLPKIGNLISGMIEPTQSMEMKDSGSANQTADIVAQTPPDQLVAAITEPQKAKNQDQMIGSYADGQLIKGAKTGGPNEDVADNKTIKATPGEYIVPVDVVEKPGVLDYLESLVKKHHVPADVQRAKTATIGIRG